MIRGHVICFCFIFNAGMITCNCICGAARCATELALQIQLQLQLQPHWAVQLELHPNKYWNDCMQLYLRMLRAIALAIRTSAMSIASKCILEWLHASVFAYAGGNCNGNSYARAIAVASMHLYVSLWVSLQWQLHSPHRCNYRANETHNYNCRCTLTAASVRASASARQMNTWMITCNCICISFLQLQWQSRL